MYVSQVMTTDLKTCKPFSSLNDVARMMWEGDCGAIPVVNDDNQPAGIVTDRDIAMAAMLNHRALWEIQASTVIQGQQICCCNKNDSLEECLRKMEQSEVRRMLVTNDDNTLVGIVSIGDALAFTKADAGFAKGDFAKGDKVAAADMIGMLKKVSAHHADGAQYAANESYAAEMSSEERPAAKASAQSASSSSASSPASSSSAQSQYRPDPGPTFRH